LFTPTTKAEAGHDLPLTEAEAIALVGADVYERVRDLSIAIYRLGAARAYENGLVLADTKFEFGDLDGEILVIDEMMTPDSSRYWPLEEYRVGTSPPSFDKQFVRDFMDSTGWNHEPPAPNMPAEVIEATSEQDAERLIARGEVQFAFVFPSDFTARVLRGERPAMAVYADATDPSATGAAVASLQQLPYFALGHDLKGPLANLNPGAPPFEVRVHKRYNPEGLTNYNVVPGLMGVILTMTLVMMTSMAMTRERERGTLENLLATPVRPFEVIYVDNASADGSAGAVRQHPLGVRVIENRSNTGFQRGNNQGLAIAEGDEILLLNPDTEVLPGSLDALFDFMRARPDAGAASPRCIRPDGTVQWTTAPFPDLAIIKAWRADTAGILQFRKTARNFNPVMATAAEVTVAEVEELVEPGAIDPDCVHTPGIYVQRIVRSTINEKRIEFRTVRRRP
jgi:hypothetical protein